MGRLIKSTIFFFLLVSQLSAQERIINYEVVLEVQKDRSVLVTENIKVYAEGIKIKRGITREFPSSRELMGQNVKLNVEILEILKNGEPEDYHTDEGVSAKTIYMGSRDVFLAKGFYDYQIKYKVPSQIGSYEGYDEIYWNAIGDNVEFVIENASCTVILPQDAKVKQEKAYTGYTGTRGADYIKRSEKNILYYNVNRALQPKEAFTIGVGFDTGHVDTLTMWDRFGTLGILYLGSLGLLLYYITSWWRYGRDPQKPEYELIYHPPDNISPAAMGYLQRGSFRNSQLTGSLVHLAINGFISLQENTQKSGLYRSFEIQKLKDSDSTLQDDLDFLMKDLFKSSNSLTIDGVYNPRVSELRSSFGKFLSDNYRSFLSEGNNLRLLWAPFLGMIAILIAGIFAHVTSVVPSSFNQVALIAFGIFGSIALVFYLFLIRKPTMEKLEIRARIKAFKEFLTIKENDKLEEHNLPELTVKHYEEILPHAIALGVDHKLSKRFRDYLDQALYVPSWTNSQYIYRDSAFVHGFRDSVSSSAVNPSTTSSGGSGGSSGGGFSGGGGGGGGVGGW